MHFVHPGTLPAHELSPAACQLVVVRGDLTPSGTALTARPGASPLPVLFKGLQQR
ncbi:hypothetical protein [Kitasatospora sp. NPDC088346]|uniref:hypothetical protein n=1 Tax=Kitasatospora sp. NPDC088346 TaxID=3364073 RepID=UPI00380944D3